MMILGGWMATIPELPVKTGRGKIIWETAQAADALGARLPELRAGRNPKAASEPANRGFVDLIQAIAAPEDPELSIEKLTGVRRAPAAFDRGLRGDGAWHRPDRRRVHRRVAWGISHERQAATSRGGGRYWTGCAIRMRSGSGGGRGRPSCRRCWMPAEG